MKSRLCLIVSLAVSFCTCFSREAYGAPFSPAQDPQTRVAATAAIPGPLRSFMRMAGISQRISTEEVLPLLARNVYAQGFEGWQAGGHPTEFLILLRRYVQQARELTLLAGPDGVIRISKCDEVRPLLQVLGYRLRQECGQSGVSLITSDPDRAFLTIDSGFPLPDLEEALQSGKPFVYPFPISRVPLLFTENDWMDAVKESTIKDKDVLDALLHDPAVARLYWALSRLDPETGATLEQSIGTKKLVPYGAVLDFYGSHISIRAGRVSVPGGPAAEPKWKDLAGASPDSPGPFVQRLLAQDRGWLAAYFDSLSRISRRQQEHFMQGDRLHRLYQAFRKSEPSADATRAAFRRAPGLLLLVSRVQWDADGEPRVPGNLEAWKEILRQKTDSKLIRQWGKRANYWTSPEQLLEAMTAISRIETDSGPLQIYLCLNELDSQRQQRLSPETARMLASKFAHYSNQYLIFSEFPELNDASILLFLKVADSLDSIPNHTLRGNALGTFQANVGIWQILARQGQIPRTDLNNSWERVVKPFDKLSSSPQLLDDGQNSLLALVRATGRPTGSQSDVIDLLAGPDDASGEGHRMHEEFAKRIQSVLDDQRLVSLDTLFALGDGLNELAQGKPVADGLIAMAGELREFEMPRPIFSGRERTEWAAGVYNNRHTELQMRTDLAKVIKSPASRAQLEHARGQLAPFMRDTLVGLNYAYYEPPGAQALHHNPLLVRSHDFSGETVTGLQGVWQAPQVFGAGYPAGGGAHMVGSLADLPYVLAEMEQDFIAPEHVQALIWRELVPGLLTNAVLPRWWGVSRNEFHAITLYQRAGEELVTASEQNQELRSKVMNILSERMAPQRLQRVEEGIRAGRPAEIISQLMPADTFYLAAGFVQRFPGDSEVLGAAGRELRDLSRRYATELSWERLSQDFGVPHPILAQSYERALLNVEPFPAFSGYSSRLMAESWDSCNLYWVRLADEMGFAPVMLNRLVPILTHRMVEKIFATDFEDWPAILRAMHETGEEFRQGKLASLPVAGAASQPETIIGRTKQ
jgi:hypothetical protein